MNTSKNARHPIRPGEEYGFSNRQRPEFQSGYLTERGLGPGSYASAFAAGVLGAFILTVLMAIGRVSGLDVFNIELVLGSMLTRTLNPGTWMLGFIWHLINGGIFACIYAFGFRTLNRASASLGTGFGFIHWLFAGLAAGLLPVLHPLVPGEFSVPGYFLANLGPMSFIGFLIAHLIFGAVVGWIYGSTQREAWLPKEEEELRKVA